MQLNIIEVVAPAVAQEKRVLAVFLQKDGMSFVSVRKMSFNRDLGVPVIAKLLPNLWIDSNQDDMS